MYIKVCGLSDKTNIEAIQQLDIDLIGLICYQKSKRCVNIADLEGHIAALPGIKRVGVFVDETEAIIRQKAKALQLDVIQLHGNESPELCEGLRKDYIVFKAIAVNDTLPKNLLINYEAVVDFFLLDTQGKEKGGNGVRFDWSVLDQYDFQVPFFLAGGIDSIHAATIRELQHPQLAGIDINSKFELKPGLKDVEKIERFLTDLKGNKRLKIS